MFNDDFDLDDIDLEMDDDIAEESIGPFGKRKPLEKLLAQKEKSIRKKCKTKEKCDEVAAAFKEEAKKFTSNLKAMRDVAKKLSKGTISKAEAKKELSPHVKMLKSNANLLQYGQIVQNKTGITDEDVKFLSNYINGIQQIIKKVKSDIGSGSNASESFIDFDFDDLSASLESLMIDEDDDFNLDLDFDDEFESLESLLDFDEDDEFDDFDLDFDDEDSAEESSFDFDLDDEFGDFDFIL